MNHTATNGVSEQERTQSTPNTVRHIAYIVTSSTSARHLLRGQLRAAREHGYSVTLICAPDKAVELFAEKEGVKFAGVPMSREIHISADIKGLVLMIYTLLTLKPDIVSASTPKAALLGTIAAWVTRVPIRVYQLRGLRLETERGKRYWLLRTLEKTTALLATRILINSASLRDIYIHMALAPSNKCDVLGAGSGNGVNTERFVPATHGVRRSIRSSLGFPPDSFVIGFIGRLTKDKGVADLVTAFELIEDSRARLLLVGPYEEADPLPAETIITIEQNSHIVTTGLIIDTLPSTQAMDIHVFLSKREGLPNVVLECACCEVPTLASRATGTIDSINDGTTGWFISDTNPASLATTIHSLMASPEKISLAGRNARKWMCEAWDSKIVWKNVFEWYDRFFK